MLTKLKYDKDNLENDKEILQKKIDEIIDDNDKLEDFIELYNDIDKEEQYKIYNKLNKFEDNIENNVDNLEKKVMNKENNLHARLNKLNDNVILNDNDK